LCVGDKIHVKIYLRSIIHSCESSVGTNGGLVVVIGQSGLVDVVVGEISVDTGVVVTAIVGGHIFVLVILNSVS